MLNAEFLVQHDRRAKAVLAEEVARQNAAARQQHIDQVLAPRRAAQQAEDNHLFQQVVPLQAVVKEFRFKSYLRAKVLVALKTVTMRPRDLSLQPGHWVFVLKNGREVTRMGEDYLDVTEIQRVTWQQLCDSPALRARVLRDEDLGWALRKLGWRGAMDKLEQRLRECYPPGGAGAHLFMRESQGSDKGGETVAYHLKPDVPWDLIWFKHRRVCPNVHCQQRVNS